jgi:hypothetical protein
MLNQLSEDKREEVTKRFSELMESGKTEEEACAIVLKEFQTSLPEPPQEEQREKTNEKEAELAGNSVVVPTPNDGEKVNKSKLTLIKKKARKSTNSVQQSVDADLAQRSQSPGSAIHASPTAADSSGSEKISVKSEGGAVVDGTSDAKTESDASNHSKPDIPTQEASIEQNPPAAELTHPLNAEPSAAASAEAPSLLSKEDLASRYGEMQFLLRSPLTSDREIDTASIAAAQGLAFIEQLTGYSQSMNENRGMLLRWVLPFDSTTSIADQSNIAAAGSYSGSGTGSAVSEEQQQRFSAVIDETAKGALLEGALALRKLVRVKLSDEADLKQGLASVTDTNTFLVALRARAQHDKMTPFELLQTL